MKIRIAVWLFLMIAFAWLAPENVEACSCARLTPCENFGNSKIIFIGRALSGTHKLATTNSKGEKTEIESGIVTFSVEEAFKGIGVTQVAIIPDGLCNSSGFMRGEQYLIYASERNGRFFVTLCSPTGPVNAASNQEDIEYLRHPPKERIGGKLYGSVSLELQSEKPAPLPGIRMVLRDASQNRIEAVTDANGNFKFTGIKPGKYMLKPLLSENYGGYGPEREVEISDRDCVREYFGVVIMGAVSGRVVDAQGRTAPAHVKLISVTDEKKQFGGSEEANEQYAVSRVEPGRYLLCIDIFSTDKESPQKSRSETYYYPGVSNRNEAAIIELGLGEKKEGYNFTLPPQLKAQTITGVVRYADGRPAANAIVSLTIEDQPPPGVYHANRFGSLVWTDAEGRFELRGFNGNLYQIAAQEDTAIAVKTYRARLFSEWMRLKLDADVKELTIVLSTTTSTQEQMRQQQQKKLR